MNPHIKQLEKHCWTHRPGGTLVDGQLHFDAEWFAELIIEHCAQRAEAYAYMSPNFTALAEELRSIKESK